MKNYILHIELFNGEQLNYKNSRYEIYTSLIVVKEDIEGIIVRHYFDKNDVSLIMFIKDVL